LGSALVEAYLGDSSTKLNSGRVKNPNGGLLCLALSSWSLVFCFCFIEATASIRFSFISTLLFYDPFAQLNVTSPNSASKGPVWFVIIV